MVGLSTQLELSEVGLLDVGLERLRSSRLAKSMRRFMDRLRPVRASWTETALSKGRIALARSGGTVRVYCLAGRAVVTVEGDYGDMELRPGSSVSVRGGTVAVTSMDDACRVRMETV